MVVKGHCETAPDLRAFLDTSRPGDFWLSAPGSEKEEAPQLEAIATTERQTLYRRLR
jgi:hypothetical protein